MSPALFLLGLLVCLLACLFETGSYYVVLDGLERKHTPGWPPARSRPPALPAEHWDARCGPRPLCVWVYLRAWVIFLHVYVYICVPLVWLVPGEPEQGTRYPETGVKESYELLWELYPCPLQDQQALSNAAISSAPMPHSIKQNKN